MQVRKTFLLLLVSLLLAIVLSACGRLEPKVERAETQIKDQEKAARLFDRKKDDAIGSETAGFDGKVIVMLGDSLTAGFDLPADQALPAVIERRLLADGANVKVVNAAVSGDTSAGGLGRYKFSVSVHKPDIVAIALGANDFLQSVDPRRTKSNLEEMIKLAEADGSEVLLIGVGAPSDSRDRRLNEFADIYPSLALKYNLPLVREMLADVRDRPEYLLADKTHPNAEGVELIANPIELELQRLLN